MNKEIRCFTQELRAAGTPDAPKIEGMAATFGTVTNIGGRFNEVIQKGAFTRTLADPTQETVCLFNHDASVILGRRSAGTLTLEQNDRGLKFSCAVPDTTAARDVYTNLKLGNIRECSFGFFVDDPDVDESWESKSDGSMLRTLKNVRLFDVSVVTFPAYGGTSASARHVVADYVEARMAAGVQMNETEVRRLKAETLLAEIAKEEADADTSRIQARYNNLFN